MTVSRNDWFRYGFYVFAYWLVLLVVGGALVGGGGWVISEQVQNFGANEDRALAAAGGLVALLGLLVYGGGQVGLAYKLVADGVATGVALGNEDADSTGEEPTVDAGDSEIGDQRETDSGRAGRSRGPRKEPGSDGGGSGVADRSERAPTAGDAEPNDGSHTETGADHGVAVPDAEATDARAGREDSRTSESPAEVASESDVAEELGFGSPADDKGTDPSAAVQDTADGDDTTVAEGDTADHEPTEQEPAGRAPTDRAADDSPSGSLADALAGGEFELDPDGESESGDDETDGSGNDRSTGPNWTTGDGHVGE